MSVLSNETTFIGTGNNCLQLYNVFTVV